MINFISGEKLNFATLLELKTKEFIVRTAHPGNFDPVTVFIAKYFTTILREDISVGADIYQPEFMITKKSKSLICVPSPNTGVAFLRSLNSTGISNPLAQHYQSLVSLFPIIKRGIEFAGDEEESATILRIVLEHQSSEFDKYYDFDGKRYNLSFSSGLGNEYKLEDEIIFIEKDRLLSLYENHLKRLKIAYSGHYLEKIDSVDISNNLFHALLIFSHIMEIKNGNVYHLCGDRMYDYFYKDSRFASINQKAFEKLFQAIQDFLNVDYRINFILVPTKHFRSFLMYKKIAEDIQTHSAHSLLKELKTIINNKSKITDKEFKRKTDIVNILISEDILTQYDIMEHPEYLSEINLQKDFFEVTFKELENLNKGDSSLLKRIIKYGHHIKHL